MRVNEGLALADDIRIEYDLGTEGLAPSDRHHLDRSVADILLLRPREKKAWLKTVRLARELEAERSGGAAAQLRQALRSWLVTPTL